MVDKFQANLRRSIFNHAYGDLLSEVTEDMIREVLKDIVSTNLKENRGGV